MVSKTAWKRWTQFTTRRGRRKGGHVWVEGATLIAERVARGVFPVQVVWEAGCREPAWPGLRQGLEAKRVPVAEISRGQLAELADTETPQGVLGLFSFSPRVLDAAWAPRGSLVLLLDGIQDPANLGALFRCAAAFRVKQLVMSKDCADVFSPRTIRASAGNVFSVEGWEDASWDQVAGPLKKAGYRILGTAAAGSRDLEASLGEGPVAVMLGSEGRGIRPEGLAVCEAFLRIPLAPGVESLNVAVAGGIVCYRFSRQPWFR